MPPKRAQGAAVAAQADSAADADPLRLAAQNAGYQTVVFKSASHPTQHDQLSQLGGRFLHHLDAVNFNGALLLCRAREVLRIGLCGSREAGLDVQIGPNEKLKQEHLTDPSPRVRIFLEQRDATAADVLTSLAYDTLVIASEGSANADRRRQLGQPPYSKYDRDFIAPFIVNSNMPVLGKSLPHLDDAEKDLLRQELFGGAAHSNEKDTSNAEHQLSGYNELQQALRNVLLRDLRNYINCKVQSWLTDLAFVYVELAMHNSEDFEPIPRTDIARAVAWVCYGCAPAFKPAATEKKGKGKHERGEAGTAPRHGDLAGLFSDSTKDEETRAQTILSLTLRFLETALRPPSSVPALNTQAVKTRPTIFEKPAFAVLPTAANLKDEALALWWLSFGFRADAVTRARNAAEERKRQQLPEAEKKKTFFMRRTKLLPASGVHCGFVVPFTTQILIQVIVDFVRLSFIGVPDEAKSILPRQWHDVNCHQNIDASDVWHIVTRMLPGLAQFGKNFVPQMIRFDGYSMRLLGYRVREQDWRALTARQRAQLHNLRPGSFNSAEGARTWRSLRKKDDEAEDEEAAAAEAAEQNEERGRLPEKDAKKITSSREVKLGTKQAPLVPELRQKMQSGAIKYVRGNDFGSGTAIMSAPAVPIAQSENGELPFVASPFVRYETQRARPNREPRPLSDKNQQWLNALNAKRANRPQEQRVTEYSMQRYRDKCGTAGAKRDAAIQEKTDIVLKVLNREMLYAAGAAYRGEQHADTITARNSWHAAVTEARGKLAALRASCLADVAALATLKQQHQQQLINATRSAWRSMVRRQEKLHQQPQTQQPLLAQIHHLEHIIATNQHAIGFVAALPETTEALRLRSECMITQDLIIHDHASRQRRAREFKTFTQRDAAVRDMVTTICDTADADELSQTLLILGDWGLDTSGCRGARPPVRRFVQIAKGMGVHIMWVQEYHTSAACPVCGIVDGKACRTCCTFDKVVVRRKQEQQQQQQPDPRRRRRNTDGLLRPAAAPAAVDDGAQSEQQRNAERNSRRQAFRDSVGADELARRRDFRRHDHDGSKSYDWQRPAAATAADNLAAPAPAPAPTFRVTVRENHDVLCCSEQKCHVVFDRDVVGATNILALGLEQLRQGRIAPDTRPKYLQHDTPFRNKFNARETADLAKQIIAAKRPRAAQQ